MQKPSLPFVIKSAEACLSLRFLKHEGDSLYFLANEIDDIDQASDTVIILAYPHFYLHTNTSSPYEALLWIVSDLKRSQEMIAFVFYADGRIVEPLDIRVHLDGKVMYRQPTESVGLSPVEAGLSWSDMALRIQAIRSRFAALDEMNSIAETDRRNIALLTWYEAHIPEFNAQCHFNADCGWGGMEDKVLEWVLSTQNPDASWKAMQLANMAEGIGTIHSKKVSGFSQAFLTEGGIAFLLEKVQDTTLSIQDTELSWNEMGTICEYVGNTLYAHEPLFKNKSQQAWQQDLLESLLPFMKQAEMNPIVLPALCSLTNKNNWSALPEMKRLYHAWEYKPSTLRDQLGLFLFRNLNAETWKELTGNEHRFYMQIRQSTYDTMRQLFIFKPFQISTFQIEVSPQIHLQRWENNRVVEDVMVASAFDYNKTKYFFESGYLAIPLQNLTSGTWYFNAIGLAGKENQFTWKSEIGVFEIE